MGRLYKPVEVSSDDNTILTIGLVDTGADDTVISEKLANELGVKLYGEYKATCASQYILKGKQALIKIKDKRDNKEIEIVVGVSDIPFDTDEVDEEGVGVILGTDFIQKTNLLNLN